MKSNGQETNGHDVSVVEKKSVCEFECQQEYAEGEIGW